jgi:hypothetical protein
MIGGKRAIVIQRRMPGYSFVYFVSLLFEIPGVFILGSCKRLMLANGVQNEAIKKLRNSRNHRRLHRGRRA